ncbi:RNA recognition motif domain-containing protein [Ditylenchus destructor]|nr:RNA recognition motif domain-containing protein [Ditylenchus destructor]
MDLQQEWILDRFFEWFLDLACRKFVLRNVSISRRQLCILSSTQISSKITSSTNNAPNSRLNHQKTTMRRFLSYLKPSTECPLKISNRDSSGVSHNFSDEHIFSPNRRYDVNRTIFVGGLTKFTTEKSLYEYFLRFGTITGCRLAREKLTGISKKYGFVEFETVEQAKNAREFPLPHVIDDQEVGVTLQSHKEFRQKFNFFVGGLSKETSVETFREYFSKFDEFVELIVTNLTPNITEKALNDYFSRYGELRRCEIKESLPGVSTGFVSFWSEKENGGEGQKFKFFVGGLSKETSVETLREYFSKFDEFVECNIPVKQASLDSAIEVNLHIIDDTKVELNYVTSEFEVLKILDDRPHTINGRMVDILSKGQKFVLYIGNLPFDATDDSLFKTFSKYGKIVHWEVKRERNTNRSLGYGYVSFEKAEQAVQAVNGGPHFLNGKTLKVDSNKRPTLSKKSIK